MEFLTKKPLITRNLGHSSYADNLRVVSFSHNYHIFHDPLARVQNEFMFLISNKFGTQTFPIVEHIFINVEVPFEDVMLDRLFINP